MSWKGAVARLQDESKERALTSLKARSKAVAKGWKRAVAKYGEADLENPCPLCSMPVEHTDVILRRPLGVEGDVMVFHAECLSQAAAIADVEREFRKLRNKILDLQELSS